MKKCQYENLLIWAIMCPLLLFMCSCDSSTNGQSETLSGFVILVNDSGDTTMDPVDFSGVLISVYQLVELDSTLVRINQNYPSIGVILSQETEFNPDISDPIAVTHAHGDGAFSIKGLAPGRYNLAFSKDQWGSVYRHDVLVGHNNDGDRLGSITLYPIHSLTNHSYTSFTFEKDHTYLIPNDVRFSGPITMEGGASIQLGYGVKMSLEQTLIKTGSGYVNISGMSGKHSIDTLLWNSVEILSSGNIIRDLLISDSNSGLLLLGAENLVTNTIFRRSNHATFLSGIGSKISRSLIIDISNKALVLNVTEGQPDIAYELESCVVMRSNVGIRTEGNSIRIVDNYFINNATAIVSNKNYHEIQYNNFEDNERAVVCAGSEITIKYNDFYEGNQNCISFAYEYYSAISSPVICQNNFYPQGGIVIYMFPLTTLDDVDARSNFWSGHDIDSLIWDNNDFESIHHKVLYMPKLTTPNTSAGIRQPDVA